MTEPSRLRPRSLSGNAGGNQEETGRLLETAKAKVKKLNGRGEVRPRVNPLDAEQLKQDELQARMAYGRARRSRERSLGLLLGWGLARFRRTRMMRSFNLFFFHYGTVMAAGAAYMLFFSVAALLWAGFSVAGIVLGENTDYQRWIIEAVQNALPGVIGDSAENGDAGLISEQDAFKLFDVSGLNLSLAIAVGVAIFTSLSWLHGLRSGIRSIWERPLMAENIVFVKLKDFGLLIMLAVAALSSATLGFVFSSRSINEVLGLIGWEIGGAAAVLASIASFFISFGLDMMIAIILMRLASRLVMPLSALWQSALIAGIGALLLRLGSTTLLSNFASSPNPVLQSFGTVLGVFFYFFVFSLVYLFAASWGAIVASEQKR